MQQMMRLMGGGPNNHEGGSEGGNSSANDNHERRDNVGIQQNWWKKVDLPSFERVELSFEGIYRRSKNYEIDRINWR